MIEHECTQAKVINQLNNTVFNGGGGLLAKTIEEYILIIREVNVKYNYHHSLNYNICIKEKMPSLL